MATRKRKAKPAVHPLDREPYRFKRTAAMADAALAHYGEPTMSLEELRAALDEELGDISLSQVILENRKAGP